MAAPGAAGDGGARAQRAGRLAHPCRPPGGRGSSGRPRQAPQRVEPTSSGRTAPSRALEACCSAGVGWGASRGWSVRCAAWSALAVRIGLTHRPWPQETGETASSDDNAALQFSTKPCLPHEYPVPACLPSRKWGRCRGRLRPATGPSRLQSRNSTPHPHHARTTGRRQCGPFAKRWRTCGPPTCEGSTMAALRARPQERHRLASQMHAPVARSLSRARRPTAVATAARSFSRRWTVAARWSPSRLFLRTRLG